MLKAAKSYLAARLKQFQYEYKCFFESGLGLKTSN